jgi:hypothetical protein
MKKFLNLIPLIALTFALSACIPNSDDIQRSDYKTISLQVLQQLETRGISRPIPDGEPLRFVHGDLYLVTATGIIIRHFRINPGNGLLVLPTTSGTPGSVGVQRLMDDGITIESVPGSITRAVIIGNYGGENPTISLPSTGNIYTLLDRELRINSQHNAWAVNLTNCPHSQVEVGGAQVQNGTLRYISTNTDNVRLYSTTIHLAPTVARFEIGEITGMGSVSRFTIDGIFMDGFYRQATINGVRSQMHNGLDIAENFYEDSHFDAPVSDTHFGIHDWRTRISDRYNNWTGTLQTSLTVRPTNVEENVYHPRRPANDRYMMRYYTWSYQVFAHDHNHQVVTTATTPAPWIIVRLSDVWVDDASGTPQHWEGPRFITVRNLMYRPTDDVQPRRLEHIRASRVYRIETIRFTEIDLTDRPNIRDIDVDITVTIAAWRRVELDVVI